MTTLKCSILSLGVLAVSLFGQAPAKAPKTPIFISPTLADSVVLITPPPKLDSKRMKQDVAEIVAIHRTANPQEIERANWDNKHENLFAIANVLGEKFTEESLPATAKLWADMNNDQGIVVSAAKKFFQHPRPYDFDSNIQSVCGSKAGGPKNSYPSGHGTVGYLSALVLTMMVPEKGEAIRARADEYAHNRVVCGDHYSADLPASKEAAQLIIGNMIGNPKFQQEFAAAKAEVRKALELPEPSQR
jgi:acid phosphatase (class A)